MSWFMVILVTASFAGFAFCMYLLGYASGSEDVLRQWDKANKRVERQIRDAADRWETR
jgi:hypothetical protein